MHHRAHAERDSVRGAEACGAQRRGDDPVTRINTDGGPRRAGQARHVVGDALELRDTWRMLTEAATGLTSAGRGCGEVLSFAFFLLLLLLTLFWVASNFLQEGILA